jgi:hypothetical protein
MDTLALSSLLIIVVLLVVVILKEPVAVGRAR